MEAATRRRDATAHREKVDQQFTRAERIDPASSEKAAEGDLEQEQHRHHRRSA
jgi:hypothetical protein